MEDIYSFYVLCIGISEDVFWNFDINFVAKCAMNKMAYETWQNSPKEG